MPYKIQSAGGGKFKVVNTSTGEVHSKATTKAKAEAQVRLLHGVKHGMKPRTTREAMGPMEHTVATAKRKKSKKGK